MTGRGPRVLRENTDTGRHAHSTEEFLHDKEEMSCACPQRTPVTHTHRQRDHVTRQVTRGSADSAPLRLQKQRRICTHLPLREVHLGAAALSIHRLPTHRRPCGCGQRTGLRDVCPWAPTAGQRRPVSVTHRGTGHGADAAASRTCRLVDAASPSAAEMTLTYMPNFKMERLPLHPKGRDDADKCGQ